VSVETVEQDGHTYPEVVGDEPERQVKINFFNKQGWGYADSGFEYVKDKKALAVKGNRYEFGSGTLLPKFAEYLSNEVNVNLSKEVTYQTDM